MCVLSMLGCAACPDEKSPLASSGSSDVTTGPSAVATEPTTSESVSDATSTDATTTTDAMTGTTAVEPPPGIDDAWCDDFSADEVYFGGAMDGFGGAIALARPTMPRAPCTGLDDLFGQVRVRPTDGKVLYLTPFGASIQVFTPEPLVWDPFVNGWVYPNKPQDNDPFLPTACDPSLGPVVFHVRPSDGAHIYRCTNEAGHNYYDPDGTLVLASVSDGLLAVGADGLFLTINDNELDVASLSLYTGVMTALPISPPAGDTSPMVLAARAHEGGFRVAVNPVGDAPPERWFIDATGVARRDGEYSLGEYGVPDMGTPEYYPREIAKLNGDGELIYIQGAPGTPERFVIVRSPLAPAPAELLYDTSVAPQNSWPGDPEPFVYIEFPFAGTLFTGP